MYKWCRPYELCSNPQFFVSGATRFDINQGNLGDCWLLAAMANLTMNEKVLNSVVCEDNSDFNEGYCGIFHFRFWHFGKFVDVVIDDLLPTKDGRTLVYNKSLDKNEFWSALLEKAYAKLYGGYAKIQGGLSSEALEDFTGGVVEVYELKHATAKIFDFIDKSMDRNVFFACAIMREKNLYGTGLHSGHAYSITDAIKLKLNPIKTVNLLRIRNPWGENEWTGAWSDRSAEWKSVSEPYKMTIGLVVHDDGEFWMSFEDFKKYFDILEICNVHPDIEMRQPNPTRKWNLISFEGNFSSCLSHEITVTDPDLYDNEDFGTVVVALMQKHSRKHERSNKAMSFTIQSLDPGSSFKASSNFKQNLNIREICYRYELKPGKYSIKPFMTVGRSDTEYLLRVFYETSHGNNLYPSIQNKSVRNEYDLTLEMNRLSLYAGNDKKFQLTKQTRKPKSKTCCTLM